MSNQQDKVGAVIIHTPGRRAFLRMFHDIPAQDIIVDGELIIELAKKLQENPGENFELNLGGVDGE